jgi:hypothetical protein
MTHFILFNHLPVLLPENARERSTERVTLDGDILILFALHQFSVDEHNRRICNENRSVTDRQRAPLHSTLMVKMRFEAGSTPLSAMHSTVRGNALPMDGMVQVGLLSGGTNKTE